MIVGETGGGKSVILKLSPVLKMRSVNQLS